MALLRMGPGIAACGASSRFRRYNVEAEEGIRSRPEVRANRICQELARRFASFPHSIGEYVRNYEKALKELSGLRYSPKDVAAFSILLSSMLSETGDADKAGWFLSALVNNGSNSRYVVFAPPTDHPIGYLGFRNSKELQVKGSVGYGCGQEMEGGRLTVEGDAGDSVGRAMSGGRIVIMGKAGRHIGELMDAGEIRLLGGYGSISKDCRPEYGGKIFIGKKLVVDGYWSDEGASYD
jgi:hypothetical protein